MRLVPPPPYDFSKLLALLRRFPCPSSFVLQGDSYIQPFRQGETLTLVRVRSEADHLRIERLVGEADGDTLRRYFARLLGTRRDLRPFYAYAQTQPALWRVIEPLVGLPLYCTPDLYHALVYVIIEQHISWAAAQRAQLALVQWGGTFIDYGGIRHYTPPAPARLASASINDLRPLKITFKRMQLLIDLSRAVVDGSLNLAELAQQPPEEVYGALLAIKGVGHWTASVVVGRVFGVYPYVPQNDVGLQAAVAHFFRTEKSAQATEDTFARYGEFAGLAAHFTLMRWVMEMYPQRSDEGQP